MNRTWTAVLMMLLVATPLALSGCIGNDDPTVTPAETDVAAEPAPAETDAQTTTTAPRAPKKAFTVGDDTNRDTIYPYFIPGQTAREPAHLEFTGEFAPEDCTTQPATFAIGNNWPSHEFTDELKAGDAVNAHVRLTYTNPEPQFADLHLWAAVPGQYFQDQELRGAVAGEVVQEFEFQFAFPGTKNDWAGAGVGCYYAANVEPVAYKLEVHLAFAEGVAPAGNPLLVRVDDGVNELRVSGAPFKPGGDVTGHYRVFDPSDRLVGEYALNSDETFDAVAVEEAGDYVIIIDHSEGGMLAIGADAPPADNVLIILETDWQRSIDFETTTPGPQQASVTRDFPRVPLGFFPWVEAAEGSAGPGKKVVIDVDSPRGRVWHMQMASFVAMNVPVGDEGSIELWTGTPGVDEWAFEYDHHTLARGEHTFQFQADHFHGTFYHWYTTYLRPGETGVPSPTAL